jgi:hypothetical protein
MPKKFTLEEFIEKANLKHSNIYTYFNADYKNSLTKIKITCLKHGDFEQTPSNHLTGTRCPICVDTKLTKEIFIQKANLKHSNRYSYDKVIYKNVKSKVIITCLKHGDFEQTPHHHLRGTSCPHCYIITTEDFIQKVNLIHGNRYDYSKVVYINGKRKIIITCPKHGDFEQKPNGHISGRGCSKCGFRCSKVAINWLKYVQYTINEEIQNMLSPLGEYRIPKTLYKADGYCEKTNTIYEFHGDIWHGNPKVYNPNDINPLVKKTYGELYHLTQIKKKKVMELGYNYIEMWEYDWKKAINVIIKIQKIWRNYLKKFYKMDSTLG